MAYSSSDKKNAERIWYVRLTSLKPSRDVLLGLLCVSSNSVGGSSLRKNEIESGVILQALRAHLSDCAGEAVLQHAEFTKLQQPKQRELDQLQQWLTRPTQGAVYLVGQDRTVWEHANPQGMFAVAPRHPRQDDSPFSSLLSGWILYLYHHLIGRHWRVC